MELNRAIKRKVKQQKYKKEAEFKLKGCSRL